MFHAFFLANDHLMLGYSYSFNNSAFHMGIPRLRFPADAPSRSSLKLEEAFYVFVPKEEWDLRLCSGLKAVDLGACPGGWTYQLVRRGMMVTAVDNGMMAQSLMDTGQVKHIRDDGFVWRPSKKNTYWLVCDMVDKPARVTHMVADWFRENDCQEAMFNLKLPMKKRYAEAVHNIEVLRGLLARSTAASSFRPNSSITIAKRSRCTSTTSSGSPSWPQVLKQHREQGMKNRTATSGFLCLGHQNR